ncbi:uncharacterized protein LOC116130354 [Pistacia vera]|uniref:uncharacterized protein LOC116130354 n=1 Tax=Pistacia vera TaxID=55513 RepID=UPI0012639752|nr:uncharacterized protein LOC116130354 [Pistacia vera]
MASDDFAVCGPPPPPPNRFLNDPTNPFQLDHGDNPSVSLVPDLLTINNYTTWSGAMQHALRANNKLGFVNGELTKPTNPSDPLLQPWERCNDMLELRERFTQQNGSRIHLKKTLAGLHQDQDLVSVYFGKLKPIWDELNLFDPLPDCTCGQLKILSDRYHRDCVIQFLMGLNDSYTNSHDQIMLLDPLPSIGKAFSLIQQQEHQHLMLNNNPSPDSMALAIKKFYPTSKPPNKSGQTQKPRPNCTHCHLSRHTFENYFKGGNAEPPTCTHCHMSDHVAEKCYKLHIYPPGHKLFNKAKSSLVFANSTSTEPDEDSSATVAFIKDQYHQFLNLLQHKEHPLMPSPSTNSSKTTFHPHANSATTPTMSGILASYPLSLSVSSQHSHTPWIIDMCATDHMVYITSLLTTNTHNVSYSVKMLDKSLKVYLEYFQDLSSWTTIWKGKLRRGLYHLLHIAVPSITLVDHLSTLSNKHDFVSTSILTNTQISDTWHYRLGHTSYSTISLIKDPIVTFHISNTNDVPCCISPLAKQH